MQNEDCGVLEVPEFVYAQEVCQQSAPVEQGGATVGGATAPGAVAGEVGAPGSNQSGDGGGQLFSSGGPTGGLAPVMPGGGCPEEFPARKILLPVDLEHPETRELAARRDPIDYAFAALFYNFPSATNPRKLW